jgi:hypothetical protein
MISFGAGKLQTGNNFIIRIHCLRGLRIVLKILTFLLRVHMSRIRVITINNCHLELFFFIYLNVFLNMTGLLHPRIRIFCAVPMLAYSGFRKICFYASYTFAKNRRHTDIKTANPVFIGGRVLPPHYE